MPGPVAPSWTPTTFKREAPLHDRPVRCVDVPARTAARVPSSSMHAADVRVDMYLLGDRIAVGGVDELSERCQRSLGATGARRGVGPSVAPAPTLWTMRTLGHFGAAGFIGSHLAASLCADGHDVVGVDAMTDYYDVALKRRNVAAIGGDRFDFVRGDLGDLDLDALLDGDSRRLYMAGQPGVRSSWHHGFGDYLRNNVERHSRHFSRTGIVFRRGRAVRLRVEQLRLRQRSQFPCFGGSLPDPISPYGVTKLAAEHLGAVLRLPVRAAGGGAALLHGLRPPSTPGHGSRTLDRGSVVGDRIPDVRRRDPATRLHVCRGRRVPRPGSPVRRWWHPDRCSTSEEEILARSRSSSGSSKEQRTRRWTSKSTRQSPGDAKSHQRRLVEGAVTNSVGHR